jgi:putative DNA primase/helicase
VIRRALAYLAKCPPAISGCGGHDQTFAVARAIVYGFDLGPEAGYQLLAEAYNPRCQPPWPERDLRHKCRDADEKPCRKPRGWLLATDSNRAHAGQKPRAAQKGAAREENRLNFTELGNARRLVNRNGADFRHVHPWKADLIWTGARWQEDQAAQLERWAKETIGDLYRQAADQPDDKRTALVAHALKSEEAKRIRAMVSLARSEPGIPVLPADLDRDPMLFNCRNGTIDLRTGRLHEHRRSDMLTSLAPVEYIPGATCPRWLSFLERIMDGNRGLMDYLQRVVGYALTGDVREQCLWFLHGTGCNGKSTFLDTLRQLLGDYAIQAVSELLLVKAHDSHPTERADLFGKRFVATIETDQGKHIAEALMKQLTGGDRIRARRMRQDFFEFPPTHKIFLAANHKPVIRGTDLAVWRRVKLVPFLVTITEQEKDKTLPEKLRAEWPGILAWAVGGCLRWQRDGLGEPAEVTQATAAYRAEQDMIQGFLNECCTIFPQASVQASILFEAYGKWSGDRWTSQKAFSQRLQEKGFECRTGHGGYKFYHGVGLPAGDLGG